MIDFRYVLIILFGFFLLTAMLFEDKTAWFPQALLYLSGFGFFFIALDIITTGMTDVSGFLSRAIGVVFWGLGMIILLITSTQQMEENWS